MQVERTSVWGLVGGREGQGGKRETWNIAQRSAAATVSRRDGRRRRLRRPRLSTRRKRQTRPRSRRFHRLPGCRESRPGSRGRCPRRAWRLRRLLTGWGGWRLLAVAVGGEVVLTPRPRLLASSPEKTTVRTVRRDLWSRWRWWLRGREGVRGRGRGRGGAFFPGRRRERVGLSSLAVVERDGRVCSPPPPYVRGVCPACVCRERTLFFSRVECEGYMMSCR